MISKAGYDFSGLRNCVVREYSCADRGDETTIKDILIGKGMEDVKSSRVQVVCQNDRVIDQGLVEKLRCSASCF
jgi:hypothetical protein